jgi:hypothetical protein
LLDETGIKIGLKHGDTISLELNYNYLISNYKLKPIYFNINFLYDDDKYSIRCHKDELLLDKINDFLVETNNNYESVEKKRIIFKYNDEDLSEFNKTLKELKIIKETDIEVLDFEHTTQESSKSLKFVNIINRKIKEKENKNYKEGLNLFIKCRNQKCEYNQNNGENKEEFIKTTILNQKLIYVLNPEKCDKCGNNLELITCGFWKCEYQFFGKYREHGCEYDYNSKPKETEGDDFDYFDPKENGNTIWIELKIYVLPRQKIKYEPNS